MERREIQSRSNRAIQALARRLAQSRVTPNQISVLSVVASLLVPLGLFGLAGIAGSVLAVAGIQLRLLANVLDGLVAVEGKKGSALGALYNEFPDRIADSVVLVSFGYFCGLGWLGWLAALLAALTAYVRVFAGALGKKQSFRGPMAKQHRMAVVSVALLLGALAPAQYAGLLLQAALALVAAGSALTCVTRAQALAQQMTGDIP